MSILRNPVFLLAFVLTASNELLERMGYSIPYVNSYLDDLACFPVVLTLALAFLRTFITSQDYSLSKIQVALAVIYFYFVFEWLLPAVSSSYTRDHADIIAYAAGAYIFWKFINGKNAVKEETV
jgi:hypothetical protein